jgi:hypothetical protein
LGSFGGFVGVVDAAAPPDFDLLMGWSQSQHPKEVIEGTDLSERELDAS